MRLVEKGEEKWDEEPASQSACNPMAKLFAFISVVAIAAGSPADFEGYVTIPNTDVGLDVQGFDINTLVALAGAFDFATVTLLCDELGDDCVGFNYWPAPASSSGKDEFTWKQFTPSTDGVTTYYSINRCIPGRNSTEIAGSCDPNSDNTYMQCPDGWGYWYVEALNQFQLPPFLLAQACDKDPRCVAFTTAEGQGNGTLFAKAGPIPNPDHDGLTTLLKVPNHKQQPPATIAQETTAESMAGANYHKLAGAVIDEQTIWSPFAGSPDLSWIKTHGTSLALFMKAECATRTGTCDGVVSCAVGNACTSPTGLPNNFNAFVTFGGRNTSSYIKPGPCFPAGGSCNITGKPYLTCPGLDFTRPTTIDTIDFPTNILIQACSTKSNCHAVISADDGSGGRLINFAAFPDCTHESSFAI
jgi:hypothetical protein